MNIDLIKLVFLEKELVGREGLKNNYIYVNFRLHRQIYFLH